MNKRRNHKQYEAATFFYFGAAGIISTFYYMFLQQKIGLNLSQIGTVTSFGAIFSLVFQPLIGCWFSKSRDKKKFILIYFMGLLLVFVGMMIVKADFIFFFAVLYGCLAIPMIGTYEIYIEAVCRQEKIKYSEIRKWGSIGMGTITLLGGSIITAFTFIGFHILGVVFIFLCMWIVGQYFITLYSEEKKTEVKILDLVSPRYIKPMYLVCFLGMGSYVGSDFAFTSYLTQICENIQTANQIFSISAGTKIFLEFLVFVIIGDVVERFKVKTVFLFIFIILCCRFALISTAVIPVVVFGDLLHCIIFPIFLTIIFDYLREIVDDRITAGCYSIISMLMFGLSNFIFPPILSWIEGRFGFQIMYLTDCVLAVSAFLIGMFMLPNKRKNIELN